MLDTGYLEKIFLIDPASRDQYPASADFLLLTVLEKLDINVKILAYIDG